MKRGDEGVGLFSNEVPITNASSSLKVLDWRHPFYMIRNAVRRLNLKATTHCMGDVEPLMSGAYTHALGSAHISPPYHRRLESSGGLFGVHCDFHSVPQLGR